MNLEQLRRLPQAVEAPGPEARELDALRERAADGVACRRRDHDLTAVAGGTHSRHGVHGEADVAGLVEAGAAAVESDPDPQLDAVRPGVVAQRALDGDRRADGGIRVLENAEVLVAARIDLTAAGSPDGRTRRRRSWIRAPPYPSPSRCRCPVEPSMSANRNVT